MILNLTDKEAYAIMQTLTSGSSLTTNTGLELGEGLEEVGSEASTEQINVEALESGKAKLETAMKRSDDKLSRALDNAISSLTDSGFDSDQIAALQSARTKATEHNLEKYPKKKK